MCEVSKMTPEAEARQIIDKKLIQSGWVIQDLRQLNLSAGVGVAVREFPTSTGPADYALFVEGNPIGVIEAKKSTAAENLTTVEEQSSRYAHSTLKYVGSDYRIRFAYEATDKLICLPTMTISNSVHAKFTHFTVRKHCGIIFLSPIPSAII